MSVLWPSWMRSKKRETPPPLPSRTPARRPARQAHVIRAKYDSAQTNSDNRKHWANADALSPDRSNTVAVRTILRSRARYEYDNNTYCSGIIGTRANDVIGTGPALQMLTDDAATNAAVEAQFAKWATDIGLAEKLRTMAEAKVRDGEAIAVLITNAAVPGPVKLDLKVIEADHLATPTAKIGVAFDSAVADAGRSEAGNEIWDGIEYDATGNPVAYYISRQHPGDMGLFANLTFDRIPARFVIHWFKTLRPGQSRGIPEIQAALPLFAQLRRYTLAVIAAAETAADFAAVLESNAPADGDDPGGVPFEELEIAKRMMMLLPGGYKAKQMEAVQPTTTYPAFTDKILGEIGRVLHMPFNVVACNSSSYNYASGRLDYQVYGTSVRVERSHGEHVVVDRVLAAWGEEAVLAQRDLAPGLGSPSAWEHCWMWNGRPHVDPLKEASGQALRLANHTTTLKDEYAHQGKDWEAAVNQRAKELDLMTKLGITAPPVTPISTKQAVPEEDDPPQAAWQGENDA